MNKINKTKNKPNQSLEDDVVLRVENLSKKFCRTLKRSMYYGTIDIARSMMGINYDTGTLRKDEFWALDDVSFELKKGETLGIIGENGSGKSTLLRLITGIFPPDKGRILFKGRIGALIAVGAGFHPHMSGRENVYLNGTILGMTKKELDERFDEIVEFADIGDFLDAPVNTYSSGMRVRLGFAIAVHCEPDILLVDEVLSVGDLAFRNKGLRKMAEYREKANALIFISHNLEQVRVLCDRCIVVHQGKILFNGETHKAVVFYENITKDTRTNSVNNKNSIIKYHKRQSVDGDRAIFNDLYFINDKKEKIDEINIKESLNVVLEFLLNEDMEEIYFTISFVDERGNTIFLWVKSNDGNKIQFKNIKAGRYRVTLSFPEHHLGPGVYFTNYHVLNGITGESLNHGFTEIAFSIKSDYYLERGIVSAEDFWFLEKID